MSWFKKLMAIAVCVSLLSVRAVDGMAIAGGDVPATPPRNGLKRGLVRAEVPEAPRKRMRESMDGGICLTPQASNSVGSGVRMSRMSPQKVFVPAKNCARRVFDCLSRSFDGNMSVLSERAVQANALQVLLEWYEKFPTLFGKIKWYVKEDKRDEFQKNFKFKLAAALHYIILSCLAESFSERAQGLMPKVAVDKHKSVSTLLLNGFSVQSVIRKEDLRASHSIDVVAEDLPRPTYDYENCMKKVMLKYFFDKDDNSEGFQNVLQKLLAGIPGRLRVNKEQFYHALIYGMIGFMGSSFSIVEAYSGEGRADLLLMNNGSTGNMQNCVIEFKYNSSAQAALAQIEDMHYGKYFGGEEAVAIGINIKKKPFNVTCDKKIIRCVKPVITRAGNKVSGSVLWA